MRSKKHKLNKRRVSISVLSLFLAMNIIACGTPSNPEANSTSNNVSANSTAGIVAQTDKANLGQEIATEPLSPTPIRIT